MLLTLFFAYLNFGRYCTTFSCSVSSDTPRYPKCFASCDACHAYHIRSSWVARRSGGTAEHLTRVVPFIQLYNDNGRLLLDSCHRKEDDLTSCRLGEETTYLHTTQTLPPATVESKVSVLSMKSYREEHREISIAISRVGLWRRGTRKKISQCNPSEGSDVRAKDSLPSFLSRSAHPLCFGAFCPPCGRGLTTTGGYCLHKRWRWRSHPGNR